MSISTPPPAVPQYPAAINFSQVSYFDDLLYNTVFGNPQDYSGVLGLSGGTPPSGVDVDHPGTIFSDLSVLAPQLNWQPQGIGYAVQNFTSFTLEWMMKMINVATTIRYQMSFGMTQQSGCTQDTNGFGMQFQVAGPCPNTPNPNFYLSSDNGGSAIYVDSGITLASVNNLWTKFTLDWNSTLQRIRLLINGVAVAQTLTNIPALGPDWPILNINQFNGGGTSGVIIFDYFKFDGFTS